MIQNISFILLSIIIYQSFFFSITLWISKEKEHHYGMLSVLTGMIGLNFLNILLIKTDLINQQVNIGVIFGFFYGPVIFQFIKSMIFKSSEIISLGWYHYVPGLVSAVLTFPFLIGYPYFNYYVYSGIITIPVILHFGWYVFQSSKTLNEYQLLLKESHSDLKAYNLNWLRSLLSIFLGLLSILIAEALLSDQNEELAGFIVFAGVLFMLGYLYYKAINQSIFLVIKKPKYDQNTLNKLEKELIFKRIELLMKEEEPWLNPELTISQLADLINVSPRNVSMIINEMASSNFYEYVNKYRIERAKNLLKKSFQMGSRIGEIMYDSGFNTKSSFNTEFKKHTGINPSAFRNKYRSTT